MVSATKLLSSINVIKEPTNPIVLNELASYLDSPVKYKWTAESDLFCNLYNASNVEKFHSDRALHCGPILYRENELDESIGEGIYIRDCYNQLYDIANKYIDVRTEFNRYRGIFFTGTPGIGKSCFRNYMIWRQAQDMKKNRLSGIILTTTLPRKSTFHGFVIDKGELVIAFSAKDVDTAMKTLKHQIDFPVYCHVDVSEGATGPIYGNYHFYYTSRNSKAWKEAKKIGHTLFCLPNWNTTELFDYYLKMGVSSAFLKKLNISSGSSEQEARGFTVLVYQQQYS